MDNGVRRDRLSISLVCIDTPLARQFSPEESKKVCRVRSVLDPSWHFERIN
jgi:hypothetical protein